MARGAGVAPTYQQDKESTVAFNDLRHVAWRSWFGSSTLTRILRRRPALCRDPPRYREVAALLHSRSFLGFRAMSIPDHHCNVEEFLGALLTIMVLVATAVCNGKNGIPRVPSPGKTIEQIDFVGLSYQPPSSI